MVAGGTANTFRGCCWDYGGMGGGGTARPRYFSAPPVFKVARGSSSSWSVSHLEEERIGLRWRRMTDDDDDGDEDLVRSGEYNYSEPVR